MTLKSINRNQTQAHKNLKVLIISQENLQLILELKREIFDSCNRIIQVYCIHNFTVNSRSTIKKIPQKAGSGSETFHS